MRSYLLPSSDFLFGPRRLMSPLRWESPPGSDETFPHLYGPLNLDAVIEVVPLETVLSE
jgi:uncharacterized protein (DUF952 family)